MRGNGRNHASDAGSGGRQINNYPSDKTGSRSLHRPCPEKSLAEAALELLCSTTTAQLKASAGVERGVEVWPGMKLSTGVDNLREAVRLRNLGFARSVSAQNM